jgi:CheY-like chemotaxis protein
VAAALRAVQPETATILITGFPSRDLKSASERAGVHRFVEKPFDLELIRGAVDEAALHGGPRPDARPPALLEVRPDGRILYANASARELLREAGLREDVPWLRDVFDASGIPDPEAASTAWVPAVAGPRRAKWEVRTHVPQPGVSGLWLLHRQGERTSPALTELLLGVEEPLDVRWPLEGRVLVVDDDELFRHVAVAILESAGAPAYAVENDAEALRLLAHDEGIAVLVVDYEIPGTDVESLVRRARAFRPDLKVVGNSAFERGADFAALGVHGFLRKPWRPRDLLAALEG